MEITRFEPFSALHLVTVLLFALLWWVLIATGARLRGGAQQNAWRNALAACLLLVWLVANLVQLMPGRYRADIVLPLQVCDIVGLVAAWVVWRPGGVPAAVLHFWGLGFSLQAVLTPDLAGGPGAVEYWTFWLPHANLVGAAIYSLIVDRYRPRWRDAAIAFGWSLVYLAVMLPFDLVTGFNYGYVGPSKPLTPSLLDVLGPWPWRLFAMAAATATVFALLAAPWALFQKPRSRA